jgi:hypothetical protein
MENNINIQTIIAALFAGNLDNDLGALHQALRLREDTLKDRKMATIKAGDTVRFTHETRPKYMVGRVGKITQVKRTKVVVDLDAPVSSGRKTWHRNIIVPVSLVEVV